MGRTMSTDEPVAFRAVITTVYPPDPESYWEHHREGFTSVSYAGPYAGKGPATAAITRKKSDAERWGRRGGPKPEVTGYVEKSSVVWERV